MASQSNVGTCDKPFPGLLEKRPVNVGSDARMRNSFVSVLNMTVIDWISVVGFDVGNEI